MTDGELAKLVGEATERMRYNARCKACQHTYHGQAQSPRVCKATITMGAGTISCGCGGEAD